MVKKPDKPSDVDRILNDANGQKQILVILIVPSHDRKNKALTVQDQWADAGLNLFCDLYGGATAFHTYAGIYLDRDANEKLRDKPILIESYAETATVLERKNLAQLVDFMKRMGKETNQKSVAVVIDNTFHEVTEY